MSTDVQIPDVSRPSAQIIPFPAGGRRAPAKDRAPSAVDTRAPQKTSQMSSQVSFGAWYHDDAISDSKHAS